VKVIFEMPMAGMEMAGVTNSRKIQLQYIVAIIEAPSL
jgi:hypothetical protein